MQKGACYVRVSTENQIENYSIEEQTDRLRAYCLAKDISIVKIYTDGGYSGGNTNRPALGQMLSDIRDGGIDLVVVYKLDRLSRSQKDTLTLIEDHFLANGVDFVSVNENFDTSTPFGRAMIGLLSVFAQLEKDQITERFTMGRIGRAKNGYYHGGGYAPTGYDYRDGELVVNDYEALQIQELFERFARGFSLHSCWQYMQSRYTTKYGAWKSESLVRNILQNEVYIGKVKFNGQVYPGRHSPIISEELFSTVQNLLYSKKGSSPLVRSPFHTSNLLSGLLYCKKCGARFHAEHGNYACYSRTKADKRYIRDPGCKNRKWRVEALDRLVSDFISGFDFEKSIEQQEHPPKINDAPRIAEIERQTARLIDLYQLGNVPLDILSGKLHALAAEKNALLERCRAQSENPAQSTSREMDFHSRLLNLFRYGELEVKRACLAQIIERILVDGEEIEIILK